MKPEEAACEGVFLAFQYPVEIPGISNAYFLRSALNAIRKYRGRGRNGRHGFPAHAAREAEAARDGRQLMNRSVNEGFSGGEKKRNEILQMAVLRAEARDSRRDRLRPRHRRAEDRGQGRERHAQPGPRSFVVVTHYQRLLNYIVPDFVHVLVDGRIVRSGGPELALELEETGYATIEAGRLPGRNAEA